MTGVLIERGEDTERHKCTGRMLCDDEGREWSDTALSQGTPNIGGHRTPSIGGHHWKLEEARKSFP